MQSDCGRTRVCVIKRLLLTYVIVVWSTGTMHRLDYQRKVFLHVLGILDDAILVAIIHLKQKKEHFYKCLVFLCDVISRGGAYGDDGLAVGIGVPGFFVELERTFWKQFLDESGRFTVNMQKMF